MQDLIIPGSAAEIAERQKAIDLRQAGEQINVMKDEFPELKRIWEAVKNKENKGDGLQKF